MSTYLGKHDTYPSTVEVIAVDETHRIKVYEQVGTGRRLYAPQHATHHRALPWTYYIEQTGPTEGEWDSWASFDKDDAMRKCKED